MGVLMRSFAGLRVLIAADPPDHTRLRRLVSRQFSVTPSGRSRDASCSK